MDTIKDTDLTHIQVGGRKYNTGFSRNNYDDDEKNLVHGAAQKADTAKEFGLVRSEMIEKERKLQESIDAERTARTAADTALGSRIDTLNASVTSNKEQTDKSIIGLRSDLEQLGSDLGADVADKVSSAAFSEEVKRQNAAHAAISDDIKKVEGTNTEQDRRIEKNETDVTALGQRVDKEAERITKTDTSVKALDMRVSEAEKNSGSSVYEQNAVLVKGNLIKEVEFGKLVLDNGNLQPNSNFGYSKFVNVAGMSKIKISTSWTGMTKGCFYSLKDTSSKLESINISGGAVYDKEVVVPKGANFAQINFSREDIINGVALIQEVGSTNIEGVLPRVKSFVPLSVSRIIENQYMNKDGGMTEYAGLHTYIYNVENIEDVFLDGGSDLLPKVSYVQIKDKSGKVLWKFDHYSNINKFNKFHLFFPEGAAELWVLFTIKVLAAKEQSEINANFTEQLDTVKKENETLKQNDVNTNNEIVGIKTRLTKVESGGGSTPTPSAPEYSLNHWKGKKIVWIGASVPKGQTTTADAAETGGSGNIMKEPYPELIAKKLECRVINNSFGNISLIARRSPEGVWSHWNPKYGSSLSLTKEEIAATGSKFKTSYEDTIIANANADLFVFDNEPNNDSTNAEGASNDVLDQFDFANWKWIDGSDFKEHRNTYQGAVLFLLDKLYEKNPYARVAFVSQFRPFTSGGWDKEFLTRTLTRNLTKKLGVPYFELQDKLQYNAINKLHYITGTSDGHLLSRTHKIIANILANEFLEIS